MYFIKSYVTQYFQNVMEDVEKAWNSMLHQLLNLLRHDLTLPKCLQIVSHLRRMDVFSETELSLKFLQTRNHYLQNCLKAIPYNDGIELSTSVMKKYLILHSS